MPGIPGFPAGPQHPLHLHYFQMRTNFYLQFLNLPTTNHTSTHGYTCQSHPLSWLHRQNLCFGFNTHKIPYSFQGLPGFDRELGLCILLPICAVIIIITETNEAPVVSSIRSISATETSLHLSLVERLYWLKTQYSCCHKTNHKLLYFQKDRLL